MDDVSGAGVGGGTGRPPDRLGPARLDSARAGAGVCEWSGRRPPPVADALGSRVVRVVTCDTD